MKNRSALLEGGYLLDGYGKACDMFEQLGRHYEIEGCWREEFVLCVATDLMQSDLLYPANPFNNQSRFVYSPNIHIRKMEL